LGIEKNYLYRDHRNKLRFYPPIPLNDFRAEAKYHLENTLISIKAKNKVVTTNVNKAKNNVTTKITDKNGKQKVIKGQLVKLREDNCTKKLFTEVLNNMLRNLKKLDPILMLKK